ncbi:Uncharacterised protein [Clostridioides difficile]|nr:Uncharacterised protein [Clostridioides difficile]
MPLLKKRTTIIITHKKGILKCADNVFNIDSVSSTKLCTTQRR